MFNKTIFKQTLKSNYKLWIIFTAILCVFSVAIISVYDPSAMSGMMDMISEMGMGDRISEMGAMTSLLGMLGSSFYSMVAVVLAIIYIIITANSLVASQVDRGSMAYTLSTPIKRSKVVGTQALYMITSVLAMVLLVIVVGLSTVQITQGAVFGEVYTDDVKAVAEILNIDNADVEDDLMLIVNDESALRAGAGARGVDEDVYSAYLTLRIEDKMYAAAAEIPGPDAGTVQNDPSLMLGNDKALAAAADVMGMDTASLRTSLESSVQMSNSEASEQMQNQLMAGLNAAAEVMEMELADLAGDMGLLKTNGGAMQAAVTVSGMPEEAWTAMINQQLASDELSLDTGLDFNVSDYLMLNLGFFLLLFAISSISFASSCIFNLSKYSLAFGAGLPIAFFLFQIMSQTSDSLSGFKYLSLNTLFDTTAITSGGSYGVQFAVLAAIGVVLYTVGLRWFRNKDLPL